MEAMSVRFLLAPLLMIVTCETFMPGPEADGDDAPKPPGPPSLSGCGEPEVWRGESCASLCDNADSYYPSRCSESGCSTTVAGYRMWEACAYDTPASGLFPLDLSCTDILDESLLDDYYYIACCCEEYDDTSGPNLDTESG